MSHTKMYLDGNALLVKPTHSVIISYIIHNRFADDVLYIWAMNISRDAYLMNSLQVHPNVATTSEVVKQIISVYNETLAPHFNKDDQSYYTAMLICDSVADISPVRLLRILNLFPVQSVRDASIYRLTCSFRYNTSSQDRGLSYIRQHLHVSRLCQCPRCLLRTEHPEPSPRNRIKVNGCFCNFCTFPMNCKYHFR